MELHFAPLQGYTDHLYRRFHAQVYGVADACYTPFIRLEKGEPRRQDIVRLESSLGDGTNLIPQIIFNSFDEFCSLAEAVKCVGFNRIDLNLGCPYPMQTHKGRGTAMISNIDEMQHIAEYIRQDSDTVYSVKMRLGQTAPDEWHQLIQLLNELPLGHVCVHPRIAKQMYGGELFTDEFHKIYEASKNPLMWNGDVLSVDDINRIASEYPNLKGIMIGRGMLTRPSLIDEWRSGVEYSQEQRLQRILELHALLYEAYVGTLCGTTQILQKIKPFWEYLEPEIGRKAAKLIRKVTKLERYNEAVQSIEA